MVLSQPKSAGPPKSGIQTVHGRKVEGSAKALTDFFRRLPLSVHAEPIDLVDFRPRGQMQDQHPPINRLGRHTCRKRKNEYEGRDFHVNEGLLDAPDTDAGFFTAGRKFLGLRRTISFLDAEVFP